MRVTSVDTVHGYTEAQVQGWSMTNPHTGYGLTVTHVEAVPHGHTATTYRLHGYSTHDPQLVGTTIEVAARYVPRLIRDALDQVTP